MRILVVNGGSSSLKCWLGDPGVGPHALWKASVDLTTPSQIAEVLKQAPRPVDVVGHRIVHGGGAFRQPAVLTAEVRAAIAQEAEVAPAHNRFELAAIETVDRVFGPDIRQIAVFDAGFHST